MRVASVLWCVAVAACASPRPMQRPGGLSAESLAALVPECGERTVVALCAAEQCEVYWCHEVARHLAAHPQAANNGRLALPGALLSHLEPVARRSPSPVFFTRGVGEPLPSAPPEAPGPAPLRVFGDQDVMERLYRLGKPGAVLDWWASGPKVHPQEWQHPLSHWESSYLEAMASSSVPAPLRMRPPVDPAHLTPEETREVQALMGRGEGAAQAYAHLENRRRIVAHYVLTHPATVRLELALYALVRDTNPLLFAVERGWQLAGGKEMFTEAEVSQLGAATEFFTALAVGVAVDKLVGLALPPPVKGKPPPFMTPEVERAFVAAVRARALRLRQYLSKEERGPVLSGALDSRTGRTFFRINLDEPDGWLHPLLKENLERYNALTKDKRLAKFATPGTHAELHALSDALYAREAATRHAITTEELSEFIIHNRALENWRGKPGIPPPCPNCQGILPPEVWVSP